MTYVTLCDAPTRLGSTGAALNVVVVSSGGSSRTGAGPNMSHAVGISRSTHIG
jgi:hypothetical protein